MSDKPFTVEESEALLHAIFPNYPDTYGMKPVPDLGAFLGGMRTTEPSKTDPVGTKARRAAG